MIVKIFDIEEGQVVLSPDILLIPVLKKIQEIYPDCYMNVYSYIHFYTNPNSAYSEHEEDELVTKLKEDFPGNYNPSEDIDIINAITFCLKCYDSISVRTFKTNRKLLDKLNRYADSVTITDGKDGNYTDLQDRLIKSEKMLQGVIAVEKIVKEELSLGRARGDQKIDKFALKKYGI